MEAWNHKAKGIVEIILEPGLCNNLDSRYAINALYFLDFIKTLPQWPWAWQRSKKGLL